MAATHEDLESKPLSMVHSLQSLLHHHLHHLDAQLADHVNNHSLHLVSLNKEVHQLHLSMLGDGAHDYYLHRARASIDRLSSMISSAKDILNTTISKIESSIRLHAQTVHARKLLELFLHISALISQVEKLLLLDYTQVHPDDLDSQSLLLLRVAQKLKILHRSIASLHEDFPSQRGHPALLVNLEPRILIAQKSIDTAIDLCFRRSLQQQNKFATLRCLYAYAALDNIAGAHDFVGLLVVAPIMDCIFSDAQSTDPLLIDELEHIQKLITAGATASNQEEKASLFVLGKALHLSCQLQSNYGACRFHGGPILPF
ncbi:hypothetical protein GOP47_0012224 [Adiantum capillus-veneris]|uniref:Uncharacterized protein n=1 Tax=Adiantum capillus-veneris TaxID=13818 RepID=A0A9D4UQA2_ADICA|nr:hypothetical protein GOP47_0012224 [Adiantum capillus-veneris]